MLGKNMTQKKVETIENYKFEPIKGYPMLNWKGKRPFTTTQYFPAQLKESYGKDENIENFNMLFWGDNLQVMSHLLQTWRGKIDLIYIDPPFDSKADYKKKIDFKNQPVTNEMSVLEEKQYTDIWSNDEYLQFMYERLIILKELLSDRGSIYVHCDYHKNYQIRCLLDEIFGRENFVNEIIWKRRGGALNNSTSFGNLTDTIYLYAKTSNYTFNAIRTRDTEEAQKYIKERFVYDDGDGRLYSRDPVTNPSSKPTPSLIYEYKGYSPPEKGWAFSRDTMEKWDKDGRLYFPSDKTQRIRRKTFLDEYQGQPIQNLWDDIYVINSQAKEFLNYPTQKPLALIERILQTSSNEGDIVFDCFCGSGTTLEAAAKMGRIFIGADINLGAIQTTTRRLQSYLKTGAMLKVYNVNNYDVFKNPVQAKELLIDALEVNKMSNSLYDGEKDGRMVKIMPVNRIATRADLNELINGFDYKAFKKRKDASPNKPVEKVLLVCMGHEVDLKASLELAVKEAGFDIDVEVVDILRDKTELQFKRDSEAKISIKKGKLVIDKFYPMNLLQKLSIQKSKVEDWKELVESVMIDWNYDGAVLSPSVIDIPEKNEFVAGEYEVPKDAGTIRIKITDLLSESLEIEVSNG